MKLTTEDLDMAASESKSKHPGRLMTVAVNAANVLMVFLDVDSRSFKEGDGFVDAVTFLDGERLC